MHALAGILYTGATAGILELTPYINPNTLNPEP